MKTKTGSGPLQGVRATTGSTGLCPAPARDTRLIREADMHDQISARMRRWGLTLLGLWLLGGACAWGQGLGTAQLELLPPHPTPTRHGHAAGSRCVDAWPAGSPVGAG